MVEEPGLPIRIPLTTTLESHGEALLHQSHKVSELRFIRKLDEKVQVIGHEYVAANKEATRHVSLRVFNKGLVSILERQEVPPLQYGAGDEVEGRFIGGENAFQPRRLAGEFGSSHLLGNNEGTDQKTNLI